jgi:hypothetical protein
VKRALAGVVDFVVGDDVRTAIAVVLAVVATAVFVHSGFDVWWLLPVVVPLAVLRSVKRAAGARR